MMAIGKCACMHGIACSGCCTFPSQRNSMIVDCSSSSRTVEQQLQRLQQRQLLLMQQQQQQKSREVREICDNENWQSMSSIDSLRRNSQPLNIVQGTGSVTKSTSYPLNMEGVQISPTRSPGSTSPCSSLGGSSHSGGPTGLRQGRLSSCSRSRQNTPDGGTLISLVSRWRTDRSSRSLGGGEAISPRSEASSPALSFHSSNSRESLNCDHVILGDRNNAPSMVCIRVYIEDERYYSFKIDSHTTAAELLDMTIQKSLAKHEPSWSIVEYIRKSHLERSIEEHESVYSVFMAWPEGSGNRFYLRTDFNKYEFFHNPNQYFPESMTHVDIPKEDCSGLLTRYELYRNILLQNLLGEDQIPDIHGYMNMREGKRSWKKYFFVLTRSGLYYAPKGNPKDVGYLNHISNLTDVDIYKAQQAKKYLSAPTNYGICLRTADGDRRSFRQFSCESDQARLCWITAMRFIKYGAQLRENFKLILKCDERLRNLENQMNGLFTENGLYSGDKCLEQKVSGSNGRVVVNHTNSSTIVNSDRYDGIHNGTVNGLPDSLSTNPARQKIQYDPIGVAAITPGGASGSTTVNKTLAQQPQPWFHSGLARDEAEYLIQQQGLIDGLFLLRDSQSMPGLTVLSFAHESQVKHCKILKETDDEGQSYYTLDGGLTRFIDLAQLVIFYQLNAGALPTRLSQSIRNKA